MSTPFTISGAFNYPADASLPADPIPLESSGSFDSEASAVLKVTGSGTINAPMGTVPAAGAKAVLVKVDAQTSVVAVNVTINGGNQPVHLAAGGMFLYFDPVPASGVTAMSFAYSAACTIRVWVLG